MKKPLISVVTPVYNTKKYLDKAVQSVLNQTFQDFEYIIVDDGSTDGSYEILQGYAEKHPDRIRLFRQENQGAYPTFNRCTELAEGQYLLHLNSDDYITEDCLEIVSSYVINQEVDVVFINTTVHFADTDQNILKRGVTASVLDEEFVILDREAVRLSWPFFFSFGLLGNNINLYKTELMKKYPYRTDWYGADYLHNINIASDVNSVACHPKNLYHHFSYIGNTEKERNISAGKYYPYEHDMFNEFFLKYKKLFLSWNTLNNENKRIIAEARIYSLNTEFNNLTAQNNDMTYLQKSNRLLSYFDDVIVEATAIVNSRKIVEEFFVKRAVELYKDEARQLLLDDNCPQDCITLLLEALREEDYPVEVRAQALRNAVSDDNNPYSLGLSYYESFCNDNPSEAELGLLDYLKAREQARVFVLTDEYDRAAEEITLLFNSPLIDPEKYALLAINCIKCGLFDDAEEIVAVGLEQFPGYQRLIDLSGKGTQK